MEASVLESAMCLHKAWVELVNFRHPGQFSSHAKDATAAQHAYRLVKDEYDEAFGQFTAACELYRQERM